MKQLNTFIIEKLRKDTLEYLKLSLRAWINRFYKGKRTEEDILAWLQDEDGLVDWADEEEIENDELGSFIHDHNDAIHEVIQDWLKNKH